MYKNVLKDLKSKEISTESIDKYVKYKQTQHAVKQDKILRFNYRSATERVEVCQKYKITTRKGTTLVLEPRCKEIGKLTRRITKATKRETQAGQKTNKKEIIDESQTTYIFPRAIKDFKET